MNDLQQQLESNFAAAYDRYEDHARRPVGSLNDLAAMLPLTADMLLSQWGASLDIKTRHDLMKSSIDAIR
ncbi:HrpF protein [Roseateles sp. YR242]|uniref:hypothetical protein n=1 Tax=Roseateles sp. YR242 TaxID=1855305 RepID=UPI0008B3B4C2|nr:hypothetical protein [Roseateles sp. YR242]SEK64267.1 HrpF protein [Roseateles sp. YR242]